MVDDAPMPREKPGSPTRAEVGYWPEYRHGDEVALFGFVALLLRQRRLLVSVGLGVALVTIGLSLWLRRYVATSAFVPRQASTGLSQLAGLASQFGVNLGSSDGAGSTDYYEALLRSRSVLTQVVLTTYHFPRSIGSKDSLSGDLVQFYDIHEGTAQDATLKAVDKLGRRMDITEDLASGLVSFTVKAPWPGLAEAIGRRILDVISDFDKNSLQSNARNERLFLENRLTAARGELTAAESTMENFLEQNRTYASSPRLVFEQQRLQRQGDLHAQGYLALAQSYEQARLTEVRDTPVLTVVDPPEGSAQPTPKLFVILAVAVLAGLGAGLGAAVARELVMRQQRERPGDIDEVRALARETLAGLFPARLLGRWRKAPSR